MNRIRNQDYPVGARVRWVDCQGNRWAGVIACQTCMRTAVRIEDGRPEYNTLSFEPEGIDLYPEDANPLVFRYTNHRGEVALRRVIPLSVHYGATEHHPTPCWLLRAWCEDRKAVRDFDLELIERNPADG